MKSLLSNKRQIITKSVTMSVFHYIPQTSTFQQASNDISLQPPIKLHIHDLDKLCYNNANDI